MNPKRIAIVAEWLTWRGGAETVVDALIEAFPKADLFTTVYNDKKLPEYKYLSPRTSFLQHIPIARDRHQSVPPLLLSAIKSLDFEGYDLIISSSSAIGKGITKPAGSKHVCYCHAPMRYVWQPEIDDRLVSKPFGKLFLDYLKKWDLKTNRSVDYFITNSKTVQNRIQKFYGRSSTVIYPPVTLLTPSSEKKKDHYITLGRLIPYKKNDLAIEACEKLGKDLHVAGDGPEAEKLSGLAKNHTKFLGRISNELKQKELCEAKALIFPAEEDFGIVPIEAFSCGTPVIAYGKGGATEYVKNNRNGILFSPQNTQSLIEAIEKFEAAKFDKEYIIKSSKQFSKDRFINEIKEFVERI